MRSIAGSRTLPHSKVQRAQIVLGCAEGESQGLIAKRLGLSPVTVGKWRRRYQDHGLEGLQDEQGPGRPRSYDEERVAEVLNTVLQDAPANGSHWSVRTLAEETGISKSTVHRWFQLFYLHPHRQRHFKIPNDPLFVNKVHDIVGLYLRPPGHAVVLWVDEKTQIQALERTQTMLPLGLGYVEGVTHEGTSKNCHTLTLAKFAGSCKPSSQLALS